MIIPTHSLKEVHHLESDPDQKYKILTPLLLIQGNTTLTLNSILKIRIKAVLSDMVEIR